jgi:hypothetical protein
MLSGCPGSSSNGNGDYQPIDDPEHIVERPSLAVPKQPFYAEKPRNEVPKETSSWWVRHFEDLGGKLRQDRKDILGEIDRLNLLFNPPPPPESIKPKTCPVKKDSEHVKKYEDFENCSLATGYSGIVQNKELCILKFDKKQYLIKKLDSGTFSKYPQQEVLADFVGAFILNQIDPHIAPINYIVVDNDGVLIGLASQIMEHYTSRDKRFGDLLKDKKGWASYKEACICPDFLPEYCDEIKESVTSLCYSSEIIKANILAKFINQVDYHNNNVGFIVDESGNIINSALVDFSNSLNLRSKSIRERLVPTKYFGQLDTAIKTFNLIKNKFGVTSLNSLDDLFEQMCAGEILKNIKSLMVEKLEDIDLQLQIATLVNDLVKDPSLELENFQKLKDNSKILTNFDSYNGENTLINFLCDKEDPDDIKYLTDILSNTNLISPCAYYCLKKGKNELLENLVDKLNLVTAELLVQKVIDASKTTEQLKLVLSLLDKLKQKNTINNTEYKPHIDLIEEGIQVLQNPNIKPTFGESLMEKFYERQARTHGLSESCLFKACDLYDHIIYKLVKMWLSQNNNTNIAPISEDSLCRKKECDSTDTGYKYCYDDGATARIFYELLMENNILAMKNWFFWVNSSIMNSDVLYELVGIGNPELLKNIFSGYDKDQLEFFTSEMHIGYKKVMFDMLKT